MAYQIIKEGLTSSIPPASGSPLSLGTTVRTSQTQARLWANPPYPKDDDHTSDSHYSPHPINKAQFFFFFFRFSNSLFPPSPLNTTRPSLCSMRVFGMLRASQESFPSFSQNWFFMYINSSHHANVSDVP